MKFKNILDGLMAGKIYSDAETGYKYRYSLRGLEVLLDNTWRVTLRDLESLMKIDFKEE